jgi:hypothetical protein
MVLSQARAAIPDSQEMSAAAQAACKRGLAYLAANQRPNGSFNSYAQGYGDTTGIVGACALAFMGMGYTPDSGEYGTNIARCTQYLVRHAQSNGVIFGGSHDGMPMYHHGLATLALAEIWGMSQDKALRDVVRRATDLIVSVQEMRPGGHFGGWRYQPMMCGADLSVTVMELMALRAAKDAGVYVPKETIDLGIKYVLRQYHASTGSFSYGSGGGSEGNFPMTGAGILALQVAGNYRAKEIDQGVKYLLQYQPVGSRDTRDAFYFYGNYYAAMGIYQAQSKGAAGIKAWNQWYPAICKQLIETQRGDGSWKGGYDPYGTAMAILILEIPCRYLPIYQR